MQLMLDFLSTEISCRINPSDHSWSLFWRCYESRLRKMVFRFRGSCLKSFLIVAFLVSVGYIHYGWRHLRIDLQNMLYFYRRSSRREHVTEKNDRFNKLFEELVAMEKFSVVLDEPREPILIPAWVKKNLVRSNDRTIGKGEVLYCTCVVFALKSFLME